MKKSIIPRHKKYEFKAIRRPGGSECWPLNDIMPGFSIEDACNRFGAGCEVKIQYFDHIQKGASWEVTFIGERPLIKRFIEAEYEVYEKRS